MTYYFVRHGQTNFNVRGLCSDNPQRDVHLTELGIRQAEMVAEKLRYIPLQRILVSPLPRTRETAHIINRHHQLRLENHPGIADIRSGFDGQPVKDYQSAIAPDRLHMRVHGGESLIDHKLRVTGFLDWMQQLDAKHILVVAHEETLRVVSGYFRGLADQEMIDLQIANGEILHFELPDNGSDSGRASD